MIIGVPILTTTLMQYMTSIGIYLFTIGITIIMILQAAFILIRGKNLKLEQAKGNEAGSGKTASNKSSLERHHSS